MRAQCNSSAKRNVNKILNVTKYEAGLQQRNDTKPGRHFHRADQTNFQCGRNRNCRRGRHATSLNSGKANSLFCVCAQYVGVWSAQLGLYWIFVPFFSFAEELFVFVKVFECCSCTHTHTSWVGIIRIVDTRIGCCKYTSQEAHTRCYCGSDVSLIRTEA